MDRQVTLLECYRATPPDQLVCVDQGFQDEVRPRPEICTIERDALIACEAPRVMECITACRELDAADPVVASSPLEAELCPESPLPCERLCWEIESLAAGEGFGSAPSAGGSVDLVELGAPFVACARERARRCQAEVASGVEPPRLVWTGALLECAGLSAELDLLD